jgi:predicted acylesterase/phospholipase RssA
MHALEDRGVPIDAVGGTSIGSLMGAAAAMGWDHEERLERALEALVRTRGLLGLTLPVVSLSSARVVTALLRGGGFFGETDAEDLWLPWFAVAASLRRAELVVIDRGPVWRGVRASCSIPGVLPPVPVGDDLLVDGGVVDDLPVATMRARHGGTVVAVDLQPDDEFAAPGFDDPVLSGWRAAARWLRPAGKRGMPNLIEIVLRAKEVGGRRAQRAARTAAAPDLLLRPPVGDVPPLAFKAATHLVELGEAHAHEALDKLEAAGRVPWST